MTTVSRWVEVVNGASLVSQLSSIVSYTWDTYMYMYLGGGGGGEEFVKRFGHGMQISMFVSVSVSIIMYFWS